MLATQDQTAALEEQDRVDRFRRLASMQGVVQPEVDRLSLPPGSTDTMSGPVPVVRVVFPERAFFAFDSAEPLPNSRPILDVIADNMKHDVPDAALTVLGHTDGVGTDAYNIDLSRRRAAAVIAALIARGVNPAQLSAVAIGKRQPIAPNNTEDGRALNRRVEFLVSPGFSANLAAVQQRVVPSTYFRLSKSEPVVKREAATPSALASVEKAVPARPLLESGPVPSTGSDVTAVKPAEPVAVPRKPEEVLPRVPSVAEVLGPMPGAQDPGALKPLGGLRLSSPTSAVARTPMMPITPVKLIPPDEVVARDLDPDGDVHF